MSAPPIRVCGCGGSRSGSRAIKSSSKSELGEITARLREFAAGYLAADPAQRLADPELIEDLVHVCIRLYAASLGSTVNSSADTDRTPLTPTEVALAATRLMDEVDLELFELGMWRNLGRGS